MYNITIKGRFATELTYFWRFKTTNQVTKFIQSIKVTDSPNKLSNRKAAMSVIKYSFSILYTTIPYDKLIKTLN